MKTETILNTDGMQESAPGTIKLCSSRERTICHFCLMLGISSVHIWLHETPNFCITKHQQANLQSYMCTKLERHHLKSKCSPGRHHSYSRSLLVKLHTRTRGKEGRRLEGTGTLHASTHTC